MLRVTEVCSQRFKLLFKPYLKFWKTVFGAVNGQVMLSNL